MKNIKKTVSTLCFLSALAVATISCKVEDPFLENTVAPVLVDVQGATFGAPFSATASVPTDSSIQEITVASRLLELDKTNILDHTKGIDSIPVANIKMVIKYTLTKTVKKDTIKFMGKTFTFFAETYSTSGTFGEVTSDANGLVTIKTSYKDLGLVDNRLQRKGDNIKITWSGMHNGVAFTRFSQIAVTDK